jgi:hypothetical protein
MQSRLFAYQDVNRINFHLDKRTLRLHAKTLQQAQ